jgi:protocatechuate 3,4-dioxygenase beta subunit
MVTTRITEYRHAGQAETAETWIQIGGRVLDAGAPVPGAWVRLETPAGEPLQTTKTNGMGQFTFSGLQAGNYQLNWRAEGFPAPAAPRPIEVPSPTGGYDLSFE